MKNYKRLTVKDSCYYDEQDNCDVDELYTRLAELEDKLENGTLIQLPCVRKVNVAGFDYVEAVYIQHNGTIGECICLNETEAGKKLEEFNNEKM